MVGRRVDQQTTQVFRGLIQNVYGLIVWEHVARAFRAGYLRKQERGNFRGNGNTRLLLAFLFRLFRKLHSVAERDD